MHNFWQKIKGSWINSLLFSCFLLFVFLGLFFLINLDFKTFFKNDSKFEMPISINLNEEIKKRLGSINILEESYLLWTIRAGLDISNKEIDQDPDGDNLANYLEYIYGTNPLLADSDSDTFSDKIEVDNGYDPDVKDNSKARPRVEIFIPKLNISVPMIWSKSENESDIFKELGNGVGHYTKAAAPGQNGNMVIYGRSSNYIWSKGDYNYIFKDLNNLIKGDEIIVTTFQKNGKVIAYNYIVSENFITMPNDVRIFENHNDPILTLVTYWPINTNLRRLIIKAEIVK
jgi:LPXTG-site transpeptidase (sortase) family protein